MQSIGLQFLSKLTTDYRISEFAKIPQDWFQAHEIEVYKFVSEYVQTYGTLPTLPTLTEKYNVEELPLDIPYTFVKEELSKRALTNKFQSIAPEINKALEHGDPREALKIVKTMVEGYEKHATANKDVYTLTELGQMVQEYVKDNRFKDGMTGIPTGWETLDKETSGWQRGDVSLMVARPKKGKAQPLDEPVLTPNGWVPIGSLVVGDKLCSPDGTIIEVTHVWDRGVLPCYKLSTNDGGSTRVAADHLWDIKHRSQDSFGTLKSTEELINWKESNQKYGRIYIPTVSPQINMGLPSQVEIDPYTFGLLLGDGSLQKTSIRITSEGQDMLFYKDRVKDITSVSNKKGTTNYTIQVSNKLLKPVLQKYGLLVTSDKKYIPESFLNTSNQNRLELLQGLMDTDGSICVSQRSVGKLSSTQIEFSSTSKKLAEGVVYLVQSLGGQARVKEGIASYIKNGIKVICKNRFRVNIQIGINPFLLPRKANLFTEYPQRLWERQITKINSIEELPCRCITVSNSNGLYITKDFIVTHNSALMGYSANAAYDAGFIPLLVSMEMKALQYSRRLFAMRANIPMNAMKSGRVTSYSEEKLGKEITLIQEKQPFYFVEGQFKRDLQSLTATIYALKPDIVFIDAGYLIKVDTRNTSKWERMSEIIEQLKYLATTANIPIVVSFQFNREVSKKDKQGKSVTEAGLENIQLSDAIGQIASVIIGIFDEEDVEVSRRRLEIIGGREGEGGTFFINWLWDNRMDFNEIRIADNTFGKYGLEEDG